MSEDRGHGKAMSEPLGEDPLFWDQLERNGTCHGETCGFPCVTKGKYMQKWDGKPTADLEERVSE